MLVRVVDNLTAHLRQEWEFSLAIDPGHDGNARLYLSGMRWVQRAPRARTWRTTSGWHNSHNARHSVPYPREERPDIPPHIKEKAWAEFQSRLSFFDPH